MNKTRRPFNPRPTARFPTGPVGEGPCMVRRYTLLKILPSFLPATLLAGGKKALFNNRSVNIILKPSEKLELIRNVQM